MNKSKSKSKSSKKSSVKTKTVYEIRSKYGNYCSEFDTVDECIKYVKDIFDMNKFSKSTTMSEFYSEYEIYPKIVFTV